MLTGKTPSITAAQIGAIVTFVVGQLVAWGVVDNAHAKVLISAGSTIIAAVWKIADAYLRGQRAQAAATSAVVAAPPSVTATPPAA